jgi:predicted transcriptional regulator
MKRTTIFVQDELERELRALARRHGRPMASLVREALEQYVVAGREAPARPGFVAAGRSGRHDIAERHEDLLFAADPASGADVSPASRRSVGPNATPRRQTGKSRAS